MRPTLPPDIAEALATWIATLPEPRPSLEEAIGLALRDWLTGQGLLPLPPKPDELH